MLITLEALPNAIEQENKFLKELKEEYPEDEYFQSLEDYESLDDFFISYKEWIDSFEDKDKEKYLKVKDSIKETKGVYVCKLNSKLYLERLTTFEPDNSKEDRNPKFIWRSFGVCDNATQVLEYLKELEKKDIIDEDSPKVILLTPMFKESQPSDGGWRWHKWGSYIGVQKHEYEYLYDEKEVEMIYCFEIIPMKKRED